MLLEKTCTEKILEKKHQIVDQGFLCLLELWVTFFSNFSVISKFWLTACATWDYQNDKLTEVVFIFLYLPSRVRLGYTHFESTHKNAQNKKNQKGVERRRGSKSGAPLHHSSSSPRHWEGFGLGWANHLLKTSFGLLCTLGSMLLFLLFRAPFPSFSQLLKTFKAVIKCHFFHGALQDAPTIRINLSCVPTTPANKVQRATCLIQMRSNCPHVGFRYWASQAETMTHSLSCSWRSSVV